MGRRGLAVFITAYGAKGWRFETRCCQKFFFNLPYLLHAELSEDETRRRKTDEAKRKMKKRLSPRRSGLHTHVEETGLLEEERELKNQAWRQRRRIRNGCEARNCQLEAHLH